MKKIFVVTLLHTIFGGGEVVTYLRSNFDFLYFPFSFILGGKHFTLKHLLVSQKGLY
jgi:hypothetical protein